MGGDFRQVGGDFLAKALEPEGPPPAQETLEVVVFELLVIWGVQVVGMIEIGVVDEDVDGMVKLLAEGFKRDITGEELVVVV